MISARLLLWAALVGVSGGLPGILLGKSFFLWLPLSLRTLMAHCILLQHCFSHGIASHLLVQGAQLASLSQCIPM